MISLNNVKIGNLLKVYIQFEATSQITEKFHILSLEKISAPFEQNFSISCVSSPTESYVGYMEKNNKFIRTYNNLPKGKYIIETLISINP